MNFRKSARADDIGNDFLNAVLNGKMYCGYMQNYIFYKSTAECDLFCILGN